MKTLRIFGLLALLLLASFAVWAKSPSEQYCDFAVKQCDLVAKHMPAITKVAEFVAARHLKGGVIGFAPINYQSLEEELIGRAGGMINLGFDRVWTKDRTPEQKANDVALISWERDPLPTDLAKMQELKKQGIYIIGFGSKKMPSIAEHIKLCDVFFDNGAAAVDCVVTLPDGTKAGRCNHLIDALNGWAFIAEVVSALTRHGKMTPMYISYAKEEGQAWGAKYLWKKQFHDDLTVAPIKAGTLGKAYLTTIRGYVQTFRRTQLSEVGKAVELLYPQASQGKKTLVLAMGHMPYTFIGRFEDARWAKLVDFEYNGHKDQVTSQKAEGALVLRLGYYGEAPDMKEILRSQKFQMIYISSDNPREGYKIPEERLMNIDMGIPFGDACVKIKDYPIPIFAPSGVMQIVAYESVNTEMLARLAVKK